MNNETKSLVFLWSRISIGTAILMKRMFGIVFGSVIIYSLNPLNY